MSFASAAPWHPVARSAELVAGHVFHARLLGQELALWRDAANRANAWENRCPHRGVRLSVGANLGSELRCLYHGLRYASGSGRCTTVPSMQTAPPPQLNLCVKVFRLAERYGFAWVSLGDPADEPRVEALDDRPTLTLRSIVVDAEPEAVTQALRHYREEPAAVLFVQPADARKAVIHGAVAGEFDARAARRVRRHHNDRLVALREAIEAAHAAPARNAPTGAPERAEAA